MAVWNGTIWQSCLSTQMIRERFEAEFRGEKVPEIDPGEVLDRFSEDPAWHALRAPIVPAKPEEEGE